MGSKEKKIMEGQNSLPSLLEEAEFYLINGAHEKAQEFLERALQIKPDAQAFYLLGMVFEAKNENDKAAEMFRKALELNPNLKEAGERLDKIVERPCL